MFDDRLKNLRLEKHLNMKQTAQRLGIPYTTYVGYEKNEREPNSEVLIALADFFNCSVDYLVGRSEEKIDESLLDKVNSIDNDLLEKYGNVYEAQKAQNIRDLENTYSNISSIHLKKFPMLGEIACGEPIWADEDKESYVMADMDIRADFCLKAKGDSMINARIHNGDIVFIREAPIVDNGEIAAVIINNEATLKRWYYYREENKLMLVAENPKYPPLVYLNEQPNEVRCLGRAVYFMSAL